MKRYGDEPHSSKANLKMKILHVIHGYPPHYMAGSEVYTWNLCRQLAREHDVFVFTRVENPYSAPYQVANAFEDGVQVWRVNKPSRDYTFADKYLDARMDDAFRAILNQIRPEVVHFGHLSHLSSQLPSIAKQEFGIPVVFTIHDFWLHCFRGQLVRPDLSVCSGPSSEGCLTCAQFFFKDWVDLPHIESHRNHMRDVMDHVDVFLSPSRTLEQFFLGQGVPLRKLRYSRYGFDFSRVTATKTAKDSETLRIGFIGRIIPVKGVDLLLRAFVETIGPASLQIWGSAEPHLHWLREICRQDPRVTFKGGYHNGEIQQVLDGMDVIVAPSIWLENSPLVIQESFLANLPVITSDAGGMSELVQDGVNGFLFPMGDEESLCQLLQKLIDNPNLLSDLEPSRDTVRAIQDDAVACASLYKELLPSQRRPVLPVRPAPWRVTFVTNPGVCNLRCPMCDTHSPYAPKELARSPQLDFGLVERTIKELAMRGLREVIPSTMGEPLLYSHFMQMIELVQGSSIRLNLTTNGTFPGRGVDSWAAALLPVLSDIKFSLNSVDPLTNTRIMGGIDSEKQLHNIQRYLELKTRHEANGGRKTTVTVQATFMESNFEELPQLLRWAIENGIDRFKGHHIWVTWPQLDQESLRRSTESAVKWNRMAATLHKIADDERCPDGHRIRLDNIESLHTESAATGPDSSLCPFLGREAWVEADGSFQVCCCPSTERREFGDFGNLNERSLMEIWRSPKYREFVASWGNHPICQTCNMRRVVPGGKND